MVLERVEDSHVSFQRDDQQQKQRKREEKGVWMLSVDIRPTKDFVPCHGEKFDHPKNVVQSFGQFEDGEAAKKSVLSSL